jgi:hypothetical protein
MRHSPSTLRSPALLIDGDEQFPTEAVVDCLLKAETEGLDLVKTYRVVRHDGLYRASSPPRSTRPSGSRAIASALPEGRRLTASSRKRLRCRL